MIPLRAAIVDDEPLARTRVRRLLLREGSGRFDIVAECADALELLTVAAETELDVLFLDIDMPEYDAFQALERWQGPLPQLVFITAHALHGPRAFDVRATDYLLKPISAERLHEALVRVWERAGRDRFEDQASLGERLALQVGRQTRLVALSEIEAVIAQGNYVEVHAAGGRYLQREPLHVFAERLGSDFMRVHRSALVRADAVRAVTSLGSSRYTLRLRSGIEVESGRSYAEAVRRVLAFKA